MVQDNGSIVVIISIASMIISFLALIVAIQAHRLEKRKFTTQEEHHQEETLSKSVKITIVENNRYEIGDWIIYSTDFVINNQMTHNVYITGMAVILNYSLSDIWDILRYGPKPFYIKVTPHYSSRTFGERLGLLKNPAIDSIRQSVGDIPCIVRDQNTNEPVLGEGNRVEIESGRIIYCWRSYLSLPKTHEILVGKHGFKLSDIIIKFLLYDGSEISDSNSGFIYRDAKDNPAIEDVLQILLTQNH